MAAKEGGHVNPQKVEEILRVHSTNSLATEEAVTGLFCNMIYFGDKKLV